MKYLGTEEVAGVDFSACCADSEGADEEDGQKRMTGLHLAAIHDSPDIARLLIMKGCPVDTQDEKVCMCPYLHEHRKKSAVTTIWCLGNREMSCLMCNDLRAVIFIPSQRGRLPFTLLFERPALMWQTN